MNPELSPRTARPGQGSLASYVAGFVLSLALTLSAYWLVTSHSLPARSLVAAIIGLALVQLIVQLALFLHLGTGSNAYWNVVVFCFALVVVLILVLGSLWIMRNLNYHMSSPDATDQMIIHDEGVTR